VRKARHGRHGRHPTIDALTTDLSDHNERPDEVLVRLELKALVQQALRELPDQLREAMALIYFEGYDADVAARFLEIPAGTLRRRLHAGRAQLRTAAERILQGSKQMNEERERHIRDLKILIKNGKIYRAVRGSLGLRPPPTELMDMILRQQMDQTSESRGVAAGKEPTGLVLEMAQRLLRPSDRASDPAHPVGVMAATIRKALPDFCDWPLNASAAAVRFFSTMDTYRDRVQAILPPGFAQGIPGAFLRATRAIVHMNASGRAQSMYEHLQDSPDVQAFRGVKGNLRLSDVLDLNWMVAGSLELRSVQHLLERLTSTVLPGSPVRFSTYDEPRYRSALQLQVGDVSARAACGGVLAGWPGRPSGVGAAHLRIFLESWATRQSGQLIDFDDLPDARTNRYELTSDPGF
jgi:hypothetical protein